MVAGDPKSAAGKRTVAIPPHPLDELDSHLDHHVLAPDDSPVFSRYDAGYAATSPSTASTRPSGQPARQPGARTCTSTTYATPGPPSRPPPAPPSPTSWPASGTPPQPWPRATSTPSTDATNRSPPHCPASPKSTSSPSTPAASPADLAWGGLARRAVWSTCLAPRPKAVGLERTEPKCPEAPVAQDALWCTRFRRNPMGRDADRGDQ